jgi:structural maintenance of chromosome 4
MFELADRLVGIYKTDNATKTVAINPGQFCVGAGGKKKEGKKADDEAEAGENRRPGRRALAAA